ncbi:hypothetical protein MBRA1_002075 [Malassezia brasiliensis]|uniref:Uncharacterized protein n=1 Tax=Malassezia brasiliensis TaxID=1821822 RepID=A0AAF0DU24_9BASI|nr:hypothetical protein MBRA1_002075 [Malassezia brasiliensis]
MVSLRRSTRVATADDEHDVRRAPSAPRKQAAATLKWPQHPVPVRAEDAEKLRVVLNSVAPSLLETRLDRHRTLRDALEKGTTLQQLWSHTLALGTAENGAAVRQDTSTHAMLLLLQHFLVELAQRYDEMPSKPTQSTNSYALHMRLPMGDYFTNAVCLDEQAAPTLDTGHAELVAVAPPIGAEPPPTLGERVPRGVRLKGRPKDDLRPVTFLSYGPYCSSFGPAYDSTGAVLDVDTTEEMYAFQRRLRAALHRRWGTGLARRAERMLARRDENGTASDSPVAEDLAMQAAALDPALDPELLQAGIASLGVDEVLADNAELVQELQELQWLRTRIGYGRVPEQEAVHALEQACADDLLASLVQLLLLPHPPRAPTRHAHPLWHQSVAALAKSLESVSLPGYWGTLPDTAYGVQSRAFLSNPPAGVPTGPQAAQPQATWAPLVRPRVLADTLTAQWIEGSGPGALAAAATAHAAAPGEAVQRAFAAPAYTRPVQAAPSTYSLGAYAAAHQAYARAPNDGRAPY